MKLVIVFLNNPDIITELMEAFLEIGISGATIVDSIGMGRILTYEIPIFAGFKELFPSSSPTNRTIFIVTEDNMVDEIFQVLEEVVGDFSKPGTGLAIVLPIYKVLGWHPGVTKE